ncbi:hypothetical protein BDW71DRAFT_205755 [Aspergillus fruticulosus]
MAISNFGMALYTSPSSPAVRESPSSSSLRHICTVKTCQHMQHQKEISKHSSCIVHGSDEREVLVAATQSQNATIAGILLGRGLNPSLPAPILDSAMDAAFYNSDISTMERLLAFGRQIPVTVRFRRQHRSQEIVALTMDLVLYQSRQR